MKPMRTMKVTTKIRASMSILMFIILLLSCFSIFNMLSIDSASTYKLAGALEKLTLMDNAIADMANIQINLRRLIYIDGSTDQKYGKVAKETLDCLDDLEAQMQKYRKMIEKLGEDVSETDYFISLLGLYRKNISDFTHLAQTMTPYYELVPIAETIDMVNEQSVSGLLKTMQSNAKTYAREAAGDCSKQAKNSVLLSVVASAAAVLTSFYFIFLSTRSIKKPLDKLENVARNVAMGRFDVEAKSNEGNEFGLLTNQFGLVVDVIKTLLKDISAIAEKRNEGDLDAIIDAEKYQGAYRDVVLKINSTLNGDTGDMFTMINAIKEYGAGNFEFEVERMKGKKEVINFALDELQANLMSVNSDIVQLVVSTTLGNLDSRINADKYKSGWKPLAESLNDLLQVIAKPVQEVSQVMEGLASGNLSVKMSSGYSGIFATLEHSINHTIGKLNSYISDINRVLTQLASDNYNLEITLEYQGDFAPVKSGLNQIIYRMNRLMEEINASAEQIADGVRMISESSTSISQGATEQSSAVEEIYMTIETILNHTKKAAQLAGGTNNLAKQAYQAAIGGNKDMENMLAAMSDIHQASNQISSIVQTIEEIAFQTNLLAFNAAVEATKAGKFGQGFDVVAKEVRALSEKSRESARETAAVIEDTLNKVNEGIKAANQTAATLSQIVDAIKEITDNINRIAESSNEQMTNLSQVNEGMGQIASVTQTNTAASEETAASAQELSSQSDLFHNMVSKYNLKQ